MTHPPRPPGHFPCDTPFYRYFIRLALDTLSCLVACDGRARATNLARWMNAFTNQIQIVEEPLKALRECCEQVIFTQLQIDALL